LSIITQWAQGPPLRGEGSGAVIATENFLIDGAPRKRLKLSGRALQADITARESHDYCGEPLTNTVITSPIQYSTGTQLNRHSLGLRLALLRGPTAKHLMTHDTESLVVSVFLYARYLVMPNDSLWLVALYGWSLFMASVIPGKSLLGQES